MHVAWFLISILLPALSVPLVPKEKNVQLPIYPQVDIVTSTISSDYPSFLELVSDPKKEVKITINKEVHL